MSEPNPKNVTKSLLEELKRLKANSTQVVSWYPHPSEVRGPFGRWLTVEEIPPEYRKNCGSRADDASYAAAAMNCLPDLIARIEELEELLAVEQFIRGELE